MEVMLSINRDSSVSIGKVESTVSDEIFLSASSQQDELLTYLKILDRSVELVPQRYRRVQKALKMRDDDVLRIMPSHVLKSRCQILVEELQTALETTENTIYMASYLSIQRFLRSLSVSLICEQTLLSVVEKTEHGPTADRIKELSPDSSGFAPPTVYCMHKTVTGRLTVSSGPQILTLPALSRCVFKSRFDKGKILQIDLTAAEPTIALMIQGKPSPKDVYQYIAETILDNEVERKDAKLITLCALYGQSPKNLKKSLPDSINPHKVIRKTKDYFDADRLVADLRYQTRSGSLRNVLGRPIKIPEGNESLLISYYLQSSAAEAAIMMFSDWCSKHEGVSIPLYVIHDALLVDCDKQLSEDLLDSKVIQLNLGDWIFDAKVTLVSNN